MPTVREIEQALFRLAPKEGAMDWDNVGQLLGDPEAEVRRVLVALDITEAVADEAIAENCQLIVSHHPVMNCKWLPVQTVRQDTPQGHLLLKILRSGLSAICMHTNLDVAPGGVNDALTAALGLEDPGPLGDPEGLCRMGTLASPMPLQEFAKHVCRALQANGVRYAGDSGPVRKVAVGGGACGDYEDAAIAAGCCSCRSYQKKNRRPLIGTEWQLIQLGGKAVKPEEGKFTLTFLAEENRIAGVGACNRIMGKYEATEKGVLKIGPLASTMMACPGMEQEDAFTKALESTTHYDMDGPMLLLLSDGELRAVFQAKP